MPDSVNGRVTASTLRNGLALCPAFQSGQCRNISCSLEHKCATVLRSGRVCDSPDHGGAGRGGRTGAGSSVCRRCRGRFFGYPLLQTFGQLCRGRGLFPVRHRRPDLRLQGRWHGTSRRSWTSSRCRTRTWSSTFPSSQPCREAESQAQAEAHVTLRPSTTAQESAAELRLVSGLSVKAQLACSWGLC